VGHEDSGSPRVKKQAEAIMGRALAACVVPLGIASVLFAAGLTAASAATAPQRAVQSTEWNDSPDPDGYYGGCLEGDSDFRSKKAQVIEAGVSLDSILAIKVLECKPFTGGGTSFIVPCPAGSPYAVCVRNDNDGMGNDIYLGVLKLNRITRPEAPNTGCPTARTSSKLELLIGAGKDPRVINGIVTLRCRPATTPTAAPAVVINCPAGPHPYAYCLATTNDGKGNAVSLGVVASNGPGDPYALYGECNGPAWSVEPGFQSKISLLHKANIPTRPIAQIDMFFCGGPTPWWPADPVQVAPCTHPKVWAFSSKRYDYCVFGTDSRNNLVRIGIITQ
jgi:hypothetical protein